MSRRKTTDRSLQGPTIPQDVSALIGPLIGFLHNSGFSGKAILAECRAAIQDVRTARAKLPVVHVDFGKDAIDIVNRWLRDPKYLNRHGRPDELPLRGPRSMTSLVKDCKVSVKPMKALLHLLNYQMVTQVASKKYRLVGKYMVFWHKEYLPFEPNFQFLVDATRAAINRLQRPKERLFWQCADSSRIHPRMTKEFLGFVKRRGLSYMHEINDWLDEHEIRVTRVKGRTIPTKRLGISLFSIASDA